MNLYDRFLLVKKRIKNRYNILIIISYILVFISLLLTYTAHNFFVENVDLSYNNIYFRRLSVFNSSNDLDKISNIDHVEAITSEKYMGYFPTQVKTLAVNGLDGTIELQPILNSNDIKTSNNTLINPNESTGIAICPIEFYPNTTSNEMNYFKILKGKEYIGTKFSVYDIEFEITDTYDSNNYVFGKNVCFISLKDFQAIKDKENQDNQIYDYFVQVDSIENVNDVKEQLSTLGYATQAMAEIDYETINQILNITNAIIIFLIIIFVLITILLIIKKNKNNKNYYSMLKNIGYSNTEIKSISNLEMLTISIISMLIAFIIYVIIFYLAKYCLLSSYFFENSNYIPPYLLIICIYIILLVLVILINSINIRKTKTS